MDVIFEDNHLLVLNKPAGILTQPSGTSQENLEFFGKKWLREKYAKQGNVFLEAVHRLDKPVSGVVLFAKTSKALSRLNASIRAKESSKIYWAWLEATPTYEGLLQHYLIHDDYQAKSVASSYPQAKLARLNFKILATRGKAALVEINLETGRYHQIRVQFSSIGCPVQGDVRYGGTKFSEQERITLHHTRLTVPHPITRENLILIAPPPHYFDSM